MKFPQPISYRRLYLGPALLLVIIVTLPLLARGDYSYLLQLGELCGIYAILVTGLTLLMGFTGQVSLGHAGFYALGAYSAAVAVRSFHAPLWVAVPIALAVGGLAALVTGFSILRLKGHYLALATLCIGVIIFQAINTLPITGAAAGLTGLPEITAFGLVKNDLGKAWLIWGVVLLVVTWAVHLTESPAGRTLRAIHGDEDAAESLGISAFSVKLKVFIASGVLAALAGVLYAFVYSPSYVGPEEFSLTFSVLAVTMVVIGGMGNVWGGIAGAVVLTGLSEVIRIVSEKAGSTDVGRYNQLVFGLMLVVIMITCRDGLLPGLKRAIHRVRRGARGQVPGSGTRHP